MNKIQLKKLINQVITEETSSENPFNKNFTFGKGSKKSGGNNASDQQSDPEEKDDESDQEEKFVPSPSDFELTFTMKPTGPLSNSGDKKKLGQLLKDINYALKKQQLTSVHAELEKAGKKVLSLNVDELSSTKEKDEFKTGNVKSVNVSKGKVQAGERPDIKGGIGYDPEDWEKAGSNDITSSKEKAKLKRAKIAAGTYDPDDTTLWSDEDWNEWERKNPNMDDKTRKTLGNFLNKMNQEK